ncbi:hypothetical protein LXN10_04030 [Arcobacter sp. KX21116]|uniref:hypothetical protein n=1 Tax=Arcobacter iocasae TaxID=2906515 RepID=UPI0035D45352
MGQISKEQKELKIKALHEAIDVLIEESTPSSNKVTYQNVLDYANEQYVLFLESKIGDKSIKSPKTQDFKDIKKRITDFKDEHKKMKTLVSKKTISETAKLKNDIESLVLQIADFYDQKLSLNEELEMKDKTIQKLKLERTKLYEEVDRLKAKYEH